MRLQELLTGAEAVLRESHLSFAKQNKRFDGLFFMDLWEGTVKKAELSKVDREGALTDFYSELLQDSRFVNVGSNKWRLREFLPFEDYKRIKSAMYGIENLERVEEENRTKELPSDSKQESVAETIEEAEAEEDSVVSGNGDEVD